jgi:hypothetical protein
MLAGATLADMKSDIHKIISGAISTTADFSASCDKTNTQIYGSYPTGVYTVLDAGTYTYSKTHSQYAGTIEYFRLVYGATNLDQIILAANYTAGTNTLVNTTTSNIYRLIFSFTSGSNTAGGSGVAYASDSSKYADGGKVLTMGNSTTYSAFAVGDNIRTWTDYNIIADSAETNTYRQLRWERNALISSANINATASTSVTHVMNWDSTVGNRLFTNYSPTYQGYRGGNVNLTTTTYTAPTYNTIDIVINSKGIFFGSAVNDVAVGIFDISKDGISREFTSTCLMAIVDVNNTNNGVQNPYAYNVTTQTYGVQVAGLDFVTPARIPRANANMTLIENPVTSSARSSGFAVDSVYGVYRVAEGTWSKGSRYVDGSGVSRVVYNNFSIPSE